MPSFRHVGHCRSPASLAHSTPRHFLLDVGSSGELSASPDAMAEVQKAGSCHAKFVFAVLALRLGRR
jgi:hypothetical protein